MSALARDIYPGRRWVRGATLIAWLLALLVPSSALALNPIVAENAHPGDAAWKGAIRAHINWLHPPLDGYAGATSVRPGGTIKFYVNVPHPARYRVEIVRLGWYGGQGGRRLTCLTGSRTDSRCRRDEPGSAQPEPPPPDASTGEVDAGWRVTDRLHVPSGWVSGYYLAIFQLTSGGNAGQTSFAPFILQAPAANRSPVLVVVPTNTWQAYNTWGGESLYTSPRAVKVSFNRPYQHRHLFRWEYPLVRFLERTGYAVAYATDDDVARDPGILLHHRLDMAAGHGEYWTSTERTAWQAARDHGVNLAFMGANTGYWQVRYEDHYRTMVSYKYSPDPERNPALKTVQFRDLSPPRPECRLLGEQYGQQDSEDGRYFNYRVTSAGAHDRWFARSGLAPGASLTGLVGFEFDSVVPSCRVPPLTVLLRWGTHPMSADAVRYRACSGSEVFDAGSLFFSWGLDSWRDPEYSPPLWPPPPPASPPLSRVMRRAIADLLVAHPRFQARRAVTVIRHGSAVRIHPGVAGATVSVRGYAVGLGADGRLRYRPFGAMTRPARVRLRVGASRRLASAVILSVGVRTGQVLGSRRYVVPVGRNGELLGPAGLLGAAGCDGSSAQVLTPVFGGASRKPLRLLVRLRRPFRIVVLQHGVRRQEKLIRRGRRAARIRIETPGIRPGRVSIVAGDRHHRLELTAIRT